jgi:poly(glycerol-phosphate) alpha-glucosyltransferase
MAVNGSLDTRSEFSVIHVTSWLSRKGGGIPPVIWALARETHLRKISVSVIGLKDQWTSDDCPETGVHYAATEVIGPSTFGFSPGMQKQLKAIAPPGIIHSHGLWMYPGLVARKYAAHTGGRLLVSPHGMLEPWALNNSRWKKRLVANLFENKNLRNADCLHALCTAEAENFRRYGLKNPIAIIPNGVDLEESASVPSNLITDRFPESKGRRRIIFLSRLHPKKGLTNLLAAWRRISVEFKDWQLLIAGSGDPLYEQELKNFAQNMILNQDVLFLGAVYGSDKKQILEAADAFVLPSFSEGFSMAVLEASAHALPVLLTRECNFPELAKSNAAIEISPDLTAVETGLRQILGMPEEQRKAMGQRGRDLMRKSYTWPVVAEEMCRVYNWLAGNGPAPKTVQN